MPVRILRILLLFIVVAQSLVAFQCKSPAQRKREAAIADSLRRDSSRHFVDPYKMGQGTQVYDQQRDAVGNLDTLVTPPQPAIPNH